jgi:hypothetical protein
MILKTEKKIKEQKLHIARNEIKSEKELLKKKDKNIEYEWLNHGDPL